MIIEELKKKGINSRENVIDYLNSNQNEINFLPDHLSELIAEIILSNTPKSIINLNSNIGEILSRCSGIEKVFGIDKNNDNVELAKYLYPHIHFSNSNPLDLTTYEKFDAVVCFPPVGERININGRIRGTGDLYILKCLDLINEKGTGIFILPQNYLTAPAFENLRRHISINFGIQKIISLPHRILRGVGPELSIITLTKNQTFSTYYWELPNINFYQSSINFSVPDFTVEKIKLTNRWDYNFHNPTNQKYEQQLSDCKSRPIKDLVDVVLGVPFKSDESGNSGNFQILSPRNIPEGLFEESRNDKFIQKKELNKWENEAVLRDGDLIFPRLLRNKIQVYKHTLNENKFIANQHLIILRGKNAEYVATYLNTKSGLRLFNQQIKRHSRGNVTPIISISDLKNIQIPILPVIDLELASKNKLEKLTYEELLEIKNKYSTLKKEYNKLKSKSSISAHEAQLSGMQTLLNQVLNNQKDISLKLDDIRNTLIELSNEFREIKKMPRDIDEKIIRLNNNLDEKLIILIKDQNQIEFYVQEIKRWFDYFDILELKSQKYLPEAEYIFDQISKLENPDYSPFILQYCRALENELLNKIFRSYVQSLLDRNLNLETEFAWDFERKDSGKYNNDNTLKLGLHLQKCLKRNQEEWFFELGSMEVNLRYLTGRTVEKSPLLKDLKSFVLHNFQEEILNIEYLDEINYIIRDYRNQSAHPNLIDTEKAILFHKLIKECFIRLMKNYKNQKIKKIKVGIGFVK
ncbi:hypothetical protein ACKGJN_11390 [Gillisia sp. Q332]|uniref:hypothetical protein n=1 Tax=Gillisia xinjiangensis TaxID=3384765 RepID=UPI00391984DB